MVVAIELIYSDITTYSIPTAKSPLPTTTHRRPRFRRSSRCHRTCGNNILLLFSLVLVFLDTTLLIVLGYTFVTTTTSTTTAIVTNIGFFQCHTNNYLDHHHHLYHHSNRQRRGLLCNMNNGNHHDNAVAAVVSITSSVSSVTASTSMNQQQQGHWNDDDGTTSTTTTTGTISPLPIMKSFDDKATNTVINNNNDNDAKPPNEAAVKIVVYGIRHGRSLSNEWMMKDENEWGSATYNDRNNIRDSPLSEHGIYQAQQLYQRLRNELNNATTTATHNHWLYHVDMILISPLTRCLQTYQYAIAPLLLLSSFDDSAVSSVQQPPSRRRRRQPAVYVHSLLTERLYSLSEMGRSVRELQTEFPDMDWSYFDSNTNNNNDDDDDDTKNNDIWWYDPTVATPCNTIHQNCNDGHNNKNDDGNRGPGLLLEKYKEWRPHGDGQFYMCPGEPEIVFQRRMEALRLWIYNHHVKLADQFGDVPTKEINSSSSNSESTTEPRIVNVLTIGHWGVYKYFTNGSELQNCQKCKFEL